MHEGEPDLYGKMNPDNAVRSARFMWVDESSVYKDTVSGPYQICLGIHSSAPSPQIKHFKIHCLFNMVNKMKKYS